MSAILRQLNMNPRQERGTGSQISTNLLVDTVDDVLAELSDDAQTANLCELAMDELATNISRTYRDIRVISQLSSAPGTTTPVLTETELALVLELGCKDDEGFSNEGVPSLESYGATVTPQESTVIALESMSDHAKTAAKKMLELYNKFMDMIISNFMKILGGAERLKKAAKSFGEKVDNGSKEAKKDKFDMNPKNLSIEDTLQEGGKLTAALALFVGFQETAADLAEKAGTLLTEVEACAENADTDTLTPITHDGKLAASQLGGKHIVMTETTKVSGTEDEEHQEEDKGEEGKTDKANSFDAVITKVSTASAAIPKFANTEKKPAKDTVTMSPCAHNEISKITSEIGKICDQIIKSRVSKITAQKNKDRLAKVVKTISSNKDQKDGKWLGANTYLGKLDALASSTSKVAGGSITVSVSSTGLAVANQALKYCIASY